MPKPIVSSFLPPCTPTSLPLPSCPFPRTLRPLPLSPSLPSFLFPSSFLLVPLFLPFYCLDGARASHMLGKALA